MFADCALLSRTLSDCVEWVAMGEKVVEAIAVARRLDGVRYGGAI